MSLLYQKQGVLENIGTHISEQKHRFGFLITVSLSCQQLKLFFPLFCIPNHLDNPKIRNTDVLSYNTSLAIQAQASASAKA